MEIKVGAATGDGNSNSSPPLLPTSSFSFSPNQLLNVGTLTNFRLRNDIMVGGTFNVSTEALIAREIEKRKIKEELLTFGHLKRRREIEQEAINELILEKELSQSHQGVSMINSYLHSLQQNELSLINRLSGGINHLDGGIDRRIPLENHVDNVIDGVLPYGTRLDDLIGGRMSLGNRSDSNSNSLPFQRQPGGASGVVCKPVIDLRKTVSQPKPEAATSKQKFETPKVDGDDVTGVVKSKKSKKTQLGWSCELCKVRVTSEQGLKDHLNGKKHKAKAQRSGAKPSNKTDNSLELSVKAKAQRSGAKPSNKTDNSSEPVVLSGSECTTPIHIACGDEGVKNEEFETDFKFWCKMCEVGTMDEAAMTAHRAGEKHLSLLNKKGGGVISINTMPDDVKYVTQA